MGKKVLSESDKVKAWDRYKAKEKEYAERYSAKLRIINRKLKEQGIIVTKAEIDQEVKK